MFAVEVADFGQTFGLVEGDLIQIVITVIQWVLGLLGLVAVILLIYAGFLWMTAAGDKAKIDRAKLVIRNTVIGLVIILLSWAIVLFVQNFLTRSRMIILRAGIAQLAVAEGLIPPS